jgi:hypothetical protein
VEAHGTRFAVLVEDVGVTAERKGWISMPDPVSDFARIEASPPERRHVQMAKVVKPHVRHAGSLLRPRPMAMQRHGRDERSELVGADRARVSPRVRRERLLGLLSPLVVGNDVECASGTRGRASVCASRTSSGCNSTGA